MSGETGSFLPENYGKAVEDLLTPRRESELGPGQPHQAAQDKLRAMNVDALFDDPSIVQSIVDPDMAKACLSALWLYHDFLDESHAISQRIDTATGSYWHAIMHRREGDHANAKHWFRRVGDHATFDSLQKAAVELAAASPAGKTVFSPTQSVWDPLSFVDLCQSVTLSRSAEETLCRRIQAREWELLFDFCYRQAIAE